MVLKADTSQEKWPARAANADLILVVEVTRVGPSAGFWSGILAASQQVRFKLVKILKGTLNASEVQVEYYLVKNDELVDRKVPRLSPKLFKVGNQLIVFLRVDKERQGASFTANQNQGTVRADPHILKILSH